MMREIFWWEGKGFCGKKKSGPREFCMGGKKKRFLWCVLTEKRESFCC